MLKRLALSIPAVKRLYDQRNSLLMQVSQLQQNRFVSDGACHQQTSFVERWTVVSLKDVLWNWRSHPYTDHSSRWRWIEQAVNSFRARREVFSVSPTRVYCRVLGRYWLTFRGEGGLIPARLMTEGHWELSVTEAIAHEIESGIVAVDIGANIGYYTVMIADYVRPGGRVYACEPVPELQRILRQNLELNWLDNGSVQIVPEPLFSAPGAQVNFFVPDDNKNAQVVADAANHGGRLLTLTTATLDDLLAHEPEVHLVKIDAEGAEMEIWKGMKRILARSPKIRIFLEFNTGRDYDPAAFLGLIEADGFSLRLLDELKGVIPVSRENLLQEKQGEDRILYLSRLQ